MLGNLSTLKCIINGKDHQYLCDQAATTVEVKEALFQFLKFVGQFEDKVKESEEKVKKEAEIDTEKKEDSIDGELTV